MIKKLRRKFVIITMLLMISTFGILFIAENVSSKYYSEYEIIKKLEWYANNDELFFEIAQFDEAVSDYYTNPVFAIHLDKNNNIVDIKSSAKNTGTAPEQSLIDIICGKNSDSSKYKSYRYVFSDLSDGERMLVICNIKKSRQEFYMMIRDIALMIAGFLIILFISFVLSKFVTEPAENALEREKRFISDASHELKTPLTAISINAQALKTSVSDNRHLDNIIAEAQKMEILIHKLLKLSYIEEIGEKIEKHSFSLSECCEEVALNTEYIAYEKKISFNYEIDENIMYYGNKDEINQVITILLDNALKHTPENSTINMKLSDKNGVVLTVENLGEGVKKEDMPHLFERFYQADASRNNDNNRYGLGLAIAKAILDSHSAAISVESDYKSKTIFKVTF